MLEYCQRLLKEKQLLVRSFDHFFNCHKQWLLCRNQTTLFPTEKIEWKLSLRGSDLHLCIHLPDAFRCLRRAHLRKLCRLNDVPRLYLLLQNRHSSSLFGKFDAVEYRFKSYCLWRWWSSNDGIMQYYITFPAWHSLCNTSLRSLCLHFVFLVRKVWVLRLISSWGYL